ncbi:hypothetical protein ACF06X_33565 [Streptomyces sp. NPDC015346]|uniref:hypothetical protein n=1 Tax=Streptomyces sp. NPDC015346 TaxID=3364954 RepID=UPI0036F5B902
MSTKTRTRRRTPKPATTPAPRPTLVDLRHPLPIRRIVGPPNAAQLAEARAALASATARLPIPVLAWHATGPTAYARLADDTLLVHTGGHTTTFTAWTPCPNGAHHQATVTDTATLHLARLAASDCSHTHGTPVPAPPTTPAVRTLADVLAAADTQPPNVTALRDEHAKEHPHG